MSVSARRKREKQERRQAILEAASHVFAERGYAQATMDQVAAAAELSKGTLYLYFKNKDDLFLALSGSILERVVSGFQAVLAGEGTGLEKLRAMLLAYAAQTEGHPDHFRSVVVFMASGHQIDTSTPTFAAHRAHIANLTAALGAAIAEGQSDGTLRPELDPMLTVAQLWGGIFGVVQIHINRDELNRRFPQPIEFEHFIEGYVDILVEGLRDRTAS